MDEEGEGAKRVGRDARSGKVLIRIDPKHYRPAEVDQLKGDSTKARDRLQWTAGVELPQLVALMVDADLKRTRAGQTFYE